MMLFFLENMDQPRLVMLLQVVCMLKQKQIAVLTILIGTIYPIIIEVLTNTRISVGGPYFNSTVLPAKIRAGKKV